MLLQTGATWQDPLISRSRYLRRKLTESLDVTVAPPSGITAESFADAACFCYDADRSLTPYNLAAVRAAAEWLEMTEDGADSGGRSLVRRTEDYIRREVAGDSGIAAAVLRSSVALLPCAPAASIAVRCVEVLASDGGTDGGWLKELTALAAEEFELIAESMRAWFAHDHDLLYRIVDHYLENHNGKLTEEEKARICYTVVPGKLSHELLIHAVQNHRLPLRFILQAILADQIHSRRSILDLPAAAHRKPPTQPPIAVSLGSILERDAAIRQAAQLSFRIESLERDLAGMRRQLRGSEAAEGRRSESFRSGGRDGDLSRSGRGLAWKLVDRLRSVFRPAAKAGDLEGEETAAVRRTQSLVW